MRRPALPVLLPSLLCWLHVARLSLAQASLSISPNVSLAQAWGSVSQVIPPSFCGMGIEPSNLFSFTGGSTTNELSVNLLQTLANHTGVPPHLRIGGNAEDYMIYDSTYPNCGIEGNPNPQGQGQVPWDSQIVGPCYFSALDRFPAGTPITFGLNFAYNAPDWPQRIAAMATAAVSGLNNTSLVSFEVGNEPDLYLQNGFRTGSWDGQVYTGQWLQRCDTVYQQVLKPNNMSATFFEPTCAASTIGNTFQIDILAQTTDILNPANNTPAGVNESYVATWNEHDYYYYIGVSSAPLTLDILMDLSTTYVQFASWTQQVQQAFSTGHSYALREMGSAGPNGIANISDSFGAALWTLNFFLYAASLNISSVEFHMTVNSYASAWQPTHMHGLPAHARSSYYAYSAMTQLIGGGCATRVAPVAIAQYPSGYTAGRLTAYASYYQDDIASLVLINTNEANASDANKASVNWNARLPNLSGRTLFLSYLTADGADSIFNTTWNGMSYEQDSTGIPVSLNETVQTVQVGPDGSVTIPVRDSQAVVANLDRQLGTGPNAAYNATACRQLVSSGAVPSEPPAKLPQPTPSATPTTSTNPRASSGPDAVHPGGAPSSTSKGGAGHAATPPPARRLVEVAALAGGIAAILA